MALGVKSRVGAFVGRYRWGTHKVADFTATPEEAAAVRSAATTDLERLFWEHDGRHVTKWSQYLPAYDHYLSAFRGSAVRFLEIGVFEGGSLELWRTFFGEAATIVGVDIDDSRAANVDPPNWTAVGSQDDPESLRSVVERMGGLDVVLDDGSHVGKHQWASFEALFPLLADGGVYIVEDLHTSWWVDYQGGDLRPTGIGLIHRVIDDMHAWYQPKPGPWALHEWVPEVHVYDSTAVIIKRRRARPLAIGSGAPR